MLKTQQTETTLPVKRQIYDLRFRKKIKTQIVALSEASDSQHKFREPLLRILALGIALTVVGTIKTILLTILRSIKNFKNE